MEKIAVFLDGASRPASPEAAAELVVFADAGTGWRAVSSVPAPLSLSGETRGAREALLRLAGELEGCRIAAGRRFSGLAFQVFNQLGFSIFELESFSPGALDRIRADVREEEARRGASAPVSPVETDVAGIYSFSLTALQKQHPEISSKTALRSFLTETPFLHLDLLCSHLPPWIGRMAQEGKIRLNLVKISETEYRAEIDRVFC